MQSELTTDYLLLGLSLYEEKIIDDFEPIYELTSLYLNIQFDCYCTSCDMDSTFKKVTKTGSSSYSPGPRIPQPEETIEKRHQRLSQGDHLIKFKCQRDNNHEYSFYFKIVNDKATKIGQYPSIADLELHKIKKYRSMLKDDYRDFSKAIGLYSHGIGAGSYVYLRRIFENLISQQKNIAFNSDPSLLETKFTAKRMDEKILYIKDYLPEILVENRQIYAILSKGIHELSEDECLSMFPKLELGIEFILDWKLVEKERQSKVKRLSQFVSEAVSKLK